MKPKPEEMEFGKFYEDDEGRVFYLDENEVRECEGGTGCTGACPGWG